MDPQTARKTVTFACLLSLPVVLYTIPAIRAVDLIGSSGYILVPYGSILALVLFGAAALVAARATMVAWITVLVLLAFVGKRRRVLARQGRRITADVAVHLVKVLMREKGLVAVVCAALVSFMAVVGVREI